MSLLLGVHVSKKSHITTKSSSCISDAITRDLDDLGLNSAQIFTHGPQNFNPNKIDYELVKKATADINLSVHSAYMSVAIWGVNETNADQVKSKKIMSALASQLAACNKIAAWGLILHVNKHYTEDLVETMKVLEPLAKKYSVKIVLEMTASKADPNKTYETPEKIDNATTLFGPDEDWWGWCIDTAHIWSAGVDVRSYADMKKWLDTITFKHKILMFHLNGSMVEMGAGRDRHAIPFGPDDKIWKGIDPKESGVRAIVEFCVARSLPMICEINYGAETDARKAFNTIIELSE